MDALTPACLPAAMVAGLFKTLAFCPRQGGARCGGMVELCCGPSTAACQLPNLS